jgi:hypothetical protein
MSAVKPEPPAQEQLNAPPVVGAHHLDALQSMLNLVFLQSGRFIKEHQSGGGSERMKLALQRAVPVANERFHDALDELENEVRLAQVVMRRDLALLKQDRKKREIAAKEKEAEKARLAAESRNTPIVQKIQEPVVEKVSTPPQPEAPAEKELEKVSSPEKVLEREEENVPPPIDTKIETTAERDPLFDGTPTTANPQENEFDFDAMFGDAMDTSGDGTNQDDNMDIDLSMPDLPDLNASIEIAAPSEPSVPIKVATSPPPPPPVAQAAPVEPPATSTTNNETEKKDTAAITNTDTTATDDLMGGMMTDNLDDLFNMDEYENPEQSSFDDAFFNFE